MGKMLVYHGCYTEVQQPRIIVGRNTKDFGTGSIARSSRNRLNAGQRDMQRRL